MPDIIDGNGVTVKTYQEILSELTTGMQEIYGADINTDSNSPDGQWLNLMTQAMVDLRELALAVNANFDPDQAAGAILDQRVVINDIERKGGTFTIQPIDLTLDRTLTLQGLDQNENLITGTGYTVQDDEGNQFILLESETLTAGDYTRNFRAAKIGLVETTLNTITSPVTVVLGVTDINNSEPAVTTGEDEESDAELRIRRQQSVAIASSGYINGLQAAVLSLSGVDYAKLYENFTDSTDGDGIPAHCIWLIVQGGSSVEIADALYSKKAPGCDMKGSVTEDITTASGATFTAMFDRPSAENLYIRFDLQGTIPVPSIDATALKQYIADNLKFDIGEYADTATITAVALAGMNATGEGAVPVNVEISDDNIAWDDYLETSALNKQWAVSTARITITVL